jgi:hypothetical protein
MARMIVQCRTSLSGNLRGEEIIVREGDLYYSDDPIVEKWPDSFGPIKVHGATEAPVEQATAAPGEKRGA